MTVLRHPRTGRTVTVRDHLIPRYLRGGWKPVESDTPAIPTPAASVSETVAWVGGDTERARIALTTELSRGRPRVTLVDQLNRLVDSDNPHEGEGEEE